MVVFDTQARQLLTFRWRVYPRVGWKTFLHSLGRFNDNLSRRHVSNFGSRQRSYRYRSRFSLHTCNYIVCRRTFKRKYMENFPKKKKDYWFLYIKTWFANLIDVLGWSERMIEGWGGGVETKFRWRERRGGRLKWVRYFVDEKMENTSCEVSTSWDDLGLRRNQILK